MSRPVFIRQKIPAERRAYSQQPEGIRGDVLPVNMHRFSHTGRGEINVVIGRERLKRAAARAQIREIRIRERPAFGRTAPEIKLLNCDQLFGSVKRQRTQQQRVNDREHRRRRADAQRKRRDRYRREYASFHQIANGVADILEERFHKCWAFQKHAIYRNRRFVFC